MIKGNDMANVTTASIITLIRGLIKDLLNSEGRDAFEYDADSSFKLSESRVSSSTIKVYQNGSELPSTEWVYNSDTNKVTITFVSSGYSLTSGDSIIITYSFYEKYSDTEITSYIKSNLVRFTQKRYKKRFYMNDSNEVVTDNGENPTREEGDLIAIITSIDIDPQNIDIRTRDFSLSATENKSKSELINDVFAQADRGYISLDFLEIEE